MTEREQQPAEKGVDSAKTETPLDAADLLDLLRRERASFRNYKRRIEQERARDREHAQKEILLRILPLLDELERALDQRPADLLSHPWTEGIALIHRRLNETLRELDVERLGKEGELFEPAYHEAVFYEERPDVQERRVSAVLRPGYRLAQVVIRPAQVSVIGPPAGREPGSKPQT